MKKLKLCDTFVGAIGTDERSNPKSERQFKLGWRWLLEGATPNASAPYHAQSARKCLPVMADVAADAANQGEILITLKEAATK